MTKEQTEFLHHLHDTIILLGGGTGVTTLLKKLEDDHPITADDVFELQKINLRLYNNVASRLTGINTYTVHKEPE